MHTVIDCRPSSCIQDAPGPSPSTPSRSHSGSGPIPADSGAPSPLGGSYSASFHLRAAGADPNACKLEMFVACNRTRLLYDLMQAVDKDDVTQVRDVIRRFRSDVALDSHLLWKIFKGFARED